MPVVNISRERLHRLIPGVSVEKILEMLPFVGLDIEGEDGKVIRVEYNPNRPDFSSDYGIARAMRGLLGVEVGIPKLNYSAFKKVSSRRNAGRDEKKVNAFSVNVDSSVKQVRPYIVSLVATSGRLDDDAIKQLISMQEDLHNGIGRKRRKASVGLHNLDVIKFPVNYKSVRGDYSFKPLGKDGTMTINQILSDTDAGKQFGYIFEEGLSDQSPSNRKSRVTGYGTGDKNYPVLVDSANTVLSFPPIINGDTSKLDNSCRNLFVEVTATDFDLAEDVLAIFAQTISDAGFEIRPVMILSPPTKLQTPRLQVRRLKADQETLNAMLGLGIKPKEIVRCLRRCRLDATTEGKERPVKITCTIPRYRTDLHHAVDLAEEVAIGYGIYNLNATFPQSSQIGQRSRLSFQLEAVRSIMTGLSILEVVNFSLISRQAWVRHHGRNESDIEALSVDGAKSAEHEILRDSLLPSLMTTLSHNIHEPYPQKIFEIGKVFKKSGKREGINEEWSLAAVVAHTNADFTEVKAILQALIVSCFSRKISTKSVSHGMFIEGRAAEITISNSERTKQMGVVGEISPSIITDFGLRVPASAFEVSLSGLFEQSGRRSSA